MRFVSLKFPALLGCIFTAGILFIQCTPPPVIHKCPEPLWREYSLLQSYQVKKEAARLETLLAAGDTTSSDSGGMTDSTAAQTLSAVDIRRRLFELSIHCANPDYDFDKICKYASFLCRHGGPDSLRYLNWGRAVREQKALLRERDSLETAISKEEKKESRSMENLKKEIKGYLKQRDSLNAVITAQQEMIMKLQKLDVMMEQQRSKIQ